MFVYVIYEVEDIGGPESGPRINTTPVTVRARNPQIAQRKFRKMSRYRNIRIDKTDRLDDPEELVEYNKARRDDSLERIFNPSYFGPYANPYIR